MVGTVVGNYRILEKLGEGGLGAVYKAVDMNLDRTVAIKALRVDLSGNPGLEQHFRTEVKALANLNHPNLAALHTLIIENGRPFMVTEFIYGESFEQMLKRRGAVTNEDAIALFQQVLAGLGYVHGMGLVHRDIKPSNLMLDQHGVVKLTDCGIAKALNPRTQIGSPAYMSPEQFLNRAPDVRSDIYSLGVTLYQMLTAQAPFSGESDYDIMAAHVNAAPPPLTSISPSVPKILESVVFKALEKNPDARFQNAEEFSAALGNPRVLAAAAGPVESGVSAAAEQIAGAVAGMPATAAQGFVFTRERTIMAVAMVAILTVAGVMVAKGAGFKWPTRQSLAQLSAAIQGLTGGATATDNAQPPPAPVPAVAATPAVPADGGAVAVAPVQPAAPVDNAPPPPVVIPAGTAIAVRLTDPVDSSANKVGDMFNASVDRAVTVDGVEAIPAGAAASVSLVNLAQVPIAKQTDVQLQLVYLSINGADYNPRTSIFEKQSAEYEKKKVIKGAAVGAAIGGIFGHKQGAADGAMSGAMKAYEIVIPSNTRIKFTLRRSITLAQ